MLSKLLLRTSSSLAVILEMDGHKRTFSHNSNVSTSNATKDIFDSSKKTRLFAKKNQRKRHPSHTTDTLDNNIVYCGYTSSSSLVRFQLTLLVPLVYPTLYPHARHFVPHRLPSSQPLAYIIARLRLAFFSFQ